MRAFRRLPERLRRRRFFRPGSFAPGEVPAAAIAYWDDDEIERRFERQRCGCGTTLGPGQDERRPLAFDGRRLLLVSRMCSECGGTSSLYFTRRA